MGNKKSVTYRLSNDALVKINTIKDAEQEKRNKLGIDEKISYADIVEEALNLYYINMIDSSAGDPYLIRMKSAIQDEIKTQFDVFVANLNSSRFDMLKTLNFLKLIVSQLDLPTESGKIFEAINSSESTEKSIEGLIYSMLLKDKQNESE